MVFNNGFKIEIEFSPIRSDEEQEYKFSDEIKAEIEVIAKEQFDNLSKRRGFPWTSTDRRHLFKIIKDNPQVTWTVVADKLNELCPNTPTSASACRRYYLSKQNEAGEIKEVQKRKNSDSCSSLKICKKDERIVKIYHEGLDAYQSQNYQNAIEILKEIEEYPEASYYAGMSHYQLCEFRQAEHLLSYAMENEWSKSIREDAVEYCRTYAKPILELCALAAKIRQADLSQVAHKQFEEELYYQDGIDFLHERKYKEASECFRKCQQNGEILFHLGLCYCMMAEDFTNQDPRKIMQVKATAKHYLNQSLDAYWSNTISLLEIRGLVADYLPTIKKYI